MSRRSMKLMLVVNYGNGDEGVMTVKNITIPTYITSIKDSDKKDKALNEHADEMVEWLNRAIARQERDDEMSGVMDSW